MTYLESQIAAKEKLVQLLDYVAHQASDGRKIQYELPTQNFILSSIKNLLGIETLTSDEQWFRVSRLELRDLPKDVEEHGSCFIKNEENAKLSFDLQVIEEFIQFKWVDAQHPRYLAVPYKRMLDIAKAMEIMAFVTTMGQWITNWIEVAQYRNEAIKSIKFYDTLFSWQGQLAMGTQENNEFVAGFGLVNWLLPSGLTYSYPLITIPLEIQIEENGAIVVGVKEVRPVIEMDALLAEDEITTSVGVREHLKVTSNDGRILNGFEPTTYSDLMAFFASGIDSKGRVLEVGATIPKGHDGPVVVPECYLFSRPHTSNVLNDDIYALKAHLNDPECDIPEQPLALVTDLSDGRKERTGVLYRGRSGSQGDGDEIHELYFPLPYNNEQVTIIKSLENSAGVTVQGPPGTGKTHSIANLICHYLAMGQKILVTAQQPHVLKTLHEKIPEEIRSLVISRIGTSLESKRQLEANIDHIIQTISQLNEFDTQREIEELARLIDSTHEAMASTDREIFNFAQHHYNTIEIGGIKRTPLTLAQYVIEHQGQYDWFKDSDIPIESGGDFPLTRAEISSLSLARHAIGSSLQYYHYGEVPDPSELITTGELRELQEDMSKLNALKSSLSGVELDTDEESLKVILFARDDLKEYLVKLIRIYENNTYPVEKIADYILKPTVEFELFNELVKDSEPLIAYRKNLLRDPILLGMPIALGSKAFKAIERGAESGVPFAWYSLSKEGQTELQGVIVSGHVAASREDWQLVKQYIENQTKVISYVARWNNIVTTIGLPKLDPQQGMSDILLMSNEITEWVSQFVGLYESIQTLNNQLLSIFKGARQFALTKITDVNDTINILSATLRKNDLQKAQDKIKHLKQVISGRVFYKSDTLVEYFLRLEQGDNSDPVISGSTSIINTLTTMSKHKEDFNVILSASEKVKKAGASFLAHAIAHDPSHGLLAENTLADTVLREDLIEAWNWHRANAYVNKISNASQLGGLYEKRKQLERSLSKSYEQIAAKKTWLALKQNASERTLVSLNRYKIAVQKIGKGTGKNAPRYRKDAQEALMQVSEAIPCWIMSHYQVSETLPAEVGMFDLVIVDEASQSSVDAIPVLLRAKKLLVVGDNKQVSPSNVGLSADQINILRNKYLHGQPHRKFLTPDMSLYDMASSIYESSVMLLEHFRCHPEIIAYSNKTYYGDRIRPMRVSKKSEQLNPPLVGIYVEDGARESKNNKHINRKEAEAIIAEMHNVFADPKCEGKTIGVISLLGGAQGEYVQTLALDTFGVEKLTSVKFACGEASSFQGAERDIIFLSMVADPMNCTALSSLAHEQRFNVAASRARERMYLVSSVKGEHLSSKDLRLGLLNHFYSRSEQISLENEEKLELCESQFEKDIFLKLIAEGYRVSPQVKVGSYRIDMVVEGNGDTRLAVELDGDSFHGPEVWSQDMIRQRDLERAGWTFWRCFASSWYLDTDEVFGSLISVLHNAGIRPDQKRGEKSE